PFVEGRSGDQASTMLEGLSPHRAIEFVFAAVDDGSVDGFAAFSFGGEGPSESPCHLAQLSLRKDHRCGVGRADELRGGESEEVPHSVGLDPTRKRSAAFADFVGGAHEKKGAAIPRSENARPDALVLPQTEDVIREQSPVSPN